MPLLGTMVQVAGKGAESVFKSGAQESVRNSATAAIDTSRAMEERFAEVSATDPLAAFCFAVGVGCVAVILLSVMSSRFKSDAKWVGTMAGKFCLILVGGFFLLLPIAMHMPGGTGNAGLWPTLGESVPAAAYMIFETMGFSADLSGWTQVIHTIMGTGALAELYYWLLAFYTVASPVALGLTAMDVLMNGFTGFMLHLESLKKSVRRRDIYVFYGLDENTSTLASDLLAHVAAHGADDPRSRMPLLVFCNVAGKTGGDGDSLSQQVRENAYGTAAVLFTPLPLENVPAKLAWPCQTRCPVYYLVLSDDANDNVQATIRLCDALTTQMMEWELVERKWDVEQVGEHPRLLPRTEAYARNVRVWCVHDNPDDDLIFDSLPQRKPDDRLVMRLLRHEGKRADAPELRERVEAQLSPLMVTVRDLVEVRLISEQREVVWDALVANPLTEVLDPVDVSQGLVGTQRLVVVMCGVGAFGLEALRACFWFGRLPGVELRIIAVDRDARRIAERVAAAWPDMAFERVPEGAPSTSRDLAHPLTGDRPAAQDGPSAAPAAVPTVAFFEADARSLEFHDLLSGKVSQGFAVSPAGLEPQELSLRKDDRVYAMVTLGDDALSLDVALRIERVLSRRLLDGTLSPASPPGQNPLVSVLVRNQEVLESVRNVSHGQEQFTLRPFGSTEEAYSYEAILAAPWEDAALNLQAAYTQSRRLGRGLSPRVTHAEAMEAFNTYEIKKLSNRAATRFTPYRLWCLGLDSQGGRPSEETAALWADKLGSSQMALELERQDRPVTELLCGIEFAHTGLDERSRAERIAAVEQADDEQRKRYPVICALGDLEHARWCAFLKAQGWGPVQGHFDALEAMNGFIGAQDDPAWPYPHESMRLMRHYYLVDQMEEYRRHGAECRDDPAAYDRTVVVQAVRAMRREVIEPAEPRHPHLRHLEAQMGSLRTRHHKGPKKPKGPAASA